MLYRLYSKQRGWLHTRGTKLRFSRDERTGDLYTFDEAFSHTLVDQTLELVPVEL